MKNKFKTILKTPFFSIEESYSVDEINKLPYYRLNEKESVVGCVLDNEDNFLLVKQYRPNLEKKTIEFPAGGIEKNETSFNALLREIREEIGFHVEYVYLGSYYLKMHRSTNLEHVFFCMNPTLIKNIKIEQGIELIKISRTKFLEIIIDNKFEQLAALGILQLASIKLGIDVLFAPLEEIKKIFNNY